MQKDDSIRQIQNHVKFASDLAKLWFESHSNEIQKGKLVRSKMGDAGTGAVYAYFNDEGNAIYVGQTGRHVKARLYDQTSPHQQKDWWENWTHMKFIQMPDPMDRLVLEFLLILAYSPIENRKPKAKKIEELFAIIQGDLSL